MGVCATQTTYLFVQLYTIDISQCKPRSSGKHLDRHGSRMPWKSEFRNKAITLLGAFIDSLMRTHAHVHKRTHAH